LVTGVVAAVFAAVLVLASPFLLLAGLVIAVIEIADHGCGSFLWRRVFCLVTFDALEVRASLKQC
jgi:hypothetical protein